MKILTALVLLFIAQSAFSTEYQLGVIAGAPTGISAKMELSRNRSLDAALAYSLADDLGVEFHFDYLIENARSFHTQLDSPFELFYGLGARIVGIRKGKHDGDLAIGPRAPIGLTYTINNPNIQFFGELALALDVIPDTNLDLEGGIGVRLRF